MPQTQQQATAHPCLHHRLLDTHGQVWVSLLWGHCSFLLHPGAHKFLFVPSESLSPVLCKFWHLYGWVNGNLLQEGLCLTQVCCIQIPYPCSRPLLTCASTGAIWESLVGMGFESKCMGGMGGMGFESVFPLLLSCWVFFFALGCRVCFSFLMGSNILLSDGCPAVSCNFGVLSGEDEHTSFLSTISD